ncbi:MAG: M48 family metalloprotease [Nitrospinae bacterium]|nr:M48 family metalloprotease [Nitrospinota bacterium]
MRIVGPLLLFLTVVAPAAFAQTFPSPSGQTRQAWEATAPKEKILDPDRDSRAALAHKVFARVRAAADKRPGPTPQLVILDEEGYPWARSLADGTTLLTVGAVKVCLAGVPRPQGEARLAFVIGHELAHQVTGDFWHYFFYQAARPDATLAPEEKEALARAVGIAKESDSVRAKELKADQYGALYASQAGYDIRAVVDADVNFFRAWGEATTPAILSGLPLGKSHPAVAERAAAVEAALGRVADELATFEKGVKAYRQGSWDLAKGHFERFLAAYQSREAFNNLGLVYYQLAAEERLAFTPEPSAFTLSLTVDPSTRGKNTLPRKERGMEMSASFSADAAGAPLRFDRYVTAARDYFNEAIARDPAYYEARNNLACLYQLKGDPSLAVGELDLALTAARDAGADAATVARYRNNRGVATLALGERLGADLAEKARLDFTEAIRLAPAYPEPLFNLALLARRTGNEPDARRWRDRLAKAAPKSELLIRLGTSIGK